MQHQQSRRWGGGETKAGDDRDSRKDDCAQGGRQDTEVTQPNQPRTSIVQHSFKYSNKSNVACTWYEGVYRFSSFPASLRTCEKPNLISLLQILQRVSLNTLYCLTDISFVYGLSH